MIDYFSCDKFLTHIHRCIVKDRGLDFFFDKKSLFCAFTSEGEKPSPDSRVLTLAVHEQVKM